MVYRKKYSGTDRPRKMETPTIKRLRMEFMLVNCKKDSPTAAESQIKVKKKPSALAAALPKRMQQTAHHYSHQIQMGSGKQDDQPTSPNKTQYTAAKMVNGIEANKAPNFPAIR
jgi:hypothetical protein